MLHFFKHRALECIAVASLFAIAILGACTAVPH